MKECKKTLDILEANQSYSTIFEIIKSYKDRIAAEYSAPNGSITSLTFSQETRRYESVAAALSKIIAPDGNFIAIKMENSLDWPAFYWAILMSGNNPLLLDASAEAPITAHLLAQAGATAIITKDCANYDVLKISPEDILNKLPEDDFSPIWGKYTALCTSGTTGTAKIYVYDEKTFCAQILSTRDILLRDETESIMYDYKKGPLKQLVFLPLHHIFGFMAVYMWFTFFGKTMVYIKDKNPATIMETCRNHHVTHVFAVPMLWNNLAQGVTRKLAMADDKTRTKLDKSMQKSLKHQQKKGKKGEKRRRTVAKLFSKVQNSLLGSDIRFLISGGGHLIPETMRTITAIGYPLHNGFGMTEAGITSVDLSGDANKRIDGSVGSPFSCCSYKISPEGELSISGDSIFSGMMKDGKFIPRASEWYSTGDYARLIDSRLFIDGRLKDVIINESGENIYPDELEDYFCGVENIIQYCILGVNTGNSYEDITLAVSISDRSNSAISTLADDINAINLQLPIYKQIRRVYITNQPFPLANGIKVKRQTLKKLIEDNTFNYAILDLHNKKLFSQGANEQEYIAKNNDPLFLELKESIRAIFADVLVLPPEKIDDFAHFVTDLGGDSLCAIGIITQIEDKYSITIPDSQLTKAVNVYETTQMIYEHLYQGK